MVLMILSNLWCFKKCLLTKLRNNFPMLVFTFWLYGWLNHIILCCLFMLFNFSVFLCFISNLNRIYSRAFSNDGLASEILLHCMTNKANNYWSYLEVQLWLLDSDLILHWYSVVCLSIWGKKFLLQDWK